MLRYEIAGIKLELEHADGSKLLKFDRFMSNYIGKPDCIIRFLQSSYFSVPEYVGSNGDAIVWLSKTVNSKVTIDVYKRQLGIIGFRIETDTDWSDISIFYCKECDINYEFTSIIGNFIMRNLAILHDGFSLHSSAISCSGKGVAFSAPSGTGKSTHTSMWEKYYGAIVLNDDCPVILNEGNNARIYGTPWSGSSDKAVNSSAPLSAIVILEQAGQNSIRELSNAEAIPLLLPRIFLPYWNASMMDLALQKYEKIISDVPKYLLKCKPDREAAEMVYQCIM